MLCLLSESVVKLHYSKISFPNSRTQNSCTPFVGHLVAISAAKVDAPEVIEKFMARRRGLVRAIRTGGQERCHDSRPGDFSVGDAAGPRGHGGGAR